METPLIFVHIPKAGGGSVRRRIATAAQNFTRDEHQWREAHLDEHIYPIINSLSKGGHYYGSHLHSIDITEESTHADDDGEDEDNSRIGAKLIL